jgi:(1->4)-alpha-D-glucan 1-alpha-D-glucosylmutase
MSRAALAARLLAAPEDGAIKLYLIGTALGHRKAAPALYELGGYRPLDAEGDRKANVVAFVRHREGKSALVVVPRLVAGLMGPDATTPPLGDQAWGQTRLILPDAPVPRRWRDLLTDAVVEVRDDGEATSLPLADLFRVLPVALLVDAQDFAG